MCIRDSSYTYHTCFTSVTQDLPLPHTDCQEFFTAMRDLIFENLCQPTPTPTPTPPSSSSSPTRVVVGSSAPVADAAAVDPSGAGATAGTGAKMKRERRVLCVFVGAYRSHGGFPPWV